MEPASPTGSPSATSPRGSSGSPPIDSPYMLSDPSQRIPSPSAFTRSGISHLGLIRSCLGVQLDFKIYKYIDITEGRIKEKSEADYGKDVDLSDLHWRQKRLFRLIANKLIHPNSPPSRDGFMEHLEFIAQLQKQAEEIVAIFFTRIQLPEEIKKGDSQEYTASLSNTLAEALRLHAKLCFDKAKSPPKQRPEPEQQIAPRKKSSSSRFKLALSGDSAKPRNGSVSPNDSPSPRSKRKHPLTRIQTKAEIQPIIDSLGSSGLDCLHQCWVRELEHPTSEMEKSLFVSDDKLLKKIDFKPPKLQAFCEILLKKKIGQSDHQQLAQDIRGALTRISVRNKDEMIIFEKKSYPNLKEIECTSFEELLSVLLKELRIPEESKLSIQEKWQTAIENDLKEQADKDTFFLSCKKLIVELAFECKRFDELLNIFLQQSRSSDDKKLTIQEKWHMAIGKELIKQRLSASFDSCCKNFIKEIASDELYQFLIVLNQQMYVLPLLLIKEVLITASNIDLDCEEGKKGKQGEKDSRSLEYQFSSKGFLFHASQSAHLLKELPGLPVYGDRIKNLISINTATTCHFFKNDYEINVEIKVLLNACLKEELPKIESLIIKPLTARGFVISELSTIGGASFPPKLTNQKLSLREFIIGDSR